MSLVRPLLVRPLLALMTAAAVSIAAAQTPPHIGRHETSAEDIAAIERVAERFRTALVTRDAAMLSALFVDMDIVFVTPPSPARQRKLAEDGRPWNPRNAAAFVDAIMSSTLPIEERFHDLKIVQDGHLAWVTFDFEFVEGGKVENHGIEVWQMLKTADGGWKIFSVVWSSHGVPK